MNPSANSPKFPDTRWSLILTSRKGDAQGRRALEELCQAYWYPLYAFARNKGNSPEMAEDLTQSFFAHLLTKDFVFRVDREAGRLRSYLLVSLKNFMHREWRKSQAKKRGGGELTISLERDVAESRYVQEPSTDANPEKEFDRRWASVLLEAVQKRLKDYYEKRGKAEEFEALCPYIAGVDPGSDYGSVAARLNMTDGGVRTATFRLRKRYREFLWREIAQTVVAPEMIQGEIDDLFSIFESE